MHGLHHLGLRMRPVRLDCILFLVAGDGWGFELKLKSGCFELDLRFRDLSDAARKIRHCLPGHLQPTGTFAFAATGFESCCWCAATGVLDCL